MKTTVQDLCTQSSGYYHPRDDKDVVMAAVIQNSLSFEYASDRLKDDKDVVMEIMMKNIKALKYASDRLKVILKKV